MLSDFNILIAIYAYIYIYKYYMCIHIYIFPKVRLSLLLFFSLFCLHLPLLLQFFLISLHNCILNSSLAEFKSPIQNVGGKCQATVKFRVQGGQSGEEVSFLGVGAPYRWDTEVLALKTHYNNKFIICMAVLVNILKVKKTFRSYSDRTNGASTTLRHPLVTDSPHNVNYNGRRGYPGR